MMTPLEAVGFDLEERLLELKKIGNPNAALVAVIARLEEKRLQMYSDLLTALKRVKVFSSCSEEQLIKVIKSMEYSVVEANALIVKQGDVGECMYFIVEGEVVISRDSDEGEIVLATLKAPDYFGEGALMTRETRRANVRAGKGSTGLKVLSSFNFHRAVDDGRQTQTESATQEKAVAKSFDDSSADTECARAAFQNCLLFANLTPTQQKKLKPLLKLATFRSGEYVATANEIGHNCYVVVKGTCRSVPLKEDENISTPRTPRSARPVTLGQSAYFGENALLRLPNAFSVITETEVTLLRLHCEDFHPRFSYMLKKMIVSKTTEDQTAHEKRTAKIIHELEAFSWRGALSWQTKLIGLARAIIRTKRDTLYRKFYRSTIDKDDKLKRQKLEQDSLSPRKRRLYLAHLKKSNNAINDDFEEEANDEDMARLADTLRRRGETRGPSYVASQTAKLLSKAPYRRSEMDAAILRGLVASSYSFEARFCKGWSHNQRNQLLRTMSLLKMEAFEPIYKVGDEANFVFVVLSGYVRLRRWQARGDETLVPGVPGYVDDEAEEVEPVTLGPGDCFGEEAFPEPLQDDDDDEHLDVPLGSLLSPKKTRDNSMILPALVLEKVVTPKKESTTTTRTRPCCAIAGAPLELLRIDRADYLCASRVDPRHMSFETKVKVLEKMPALKHLDSFRLAKLAYAMTEIWYPKGAIVASEGKSLDHFQLVVRGSAVASVSTDGAAARTAVNAAASSKTRKSKRRKKDDDDDDDEYSSSCPILAALKASAGYGAHARAIFGDRALQLKTTGVGDYFGDSGLINALKKDTTTCRSKKKNKTTELCTIIVSSAELVTLSLPLPLAEESSLFDERDLGVLVENRALREEWRRTQVLTLARAALRRSSDDQVGVSKLRALKHTKQHQKKKQHLIIQGEEDGQKTPSSSPKKRLILPPYHLAPLSSPQTHLPLFFDQQQASSSLVAPAAAAASFSRSSAVQLPPHFFRQAPRY